MLRRNALFALTLFSIAIVMVITGCQPSAASLIESGDANFASKNYDQAIADYTKAIDIDSESAVAYASRGRAYYNEEMYDEALADLNKAIELDPNSYTAYFRRGYAYTLQTL